MRSPCCQCVCVSPLSDFECLNQSLWNLVCTVFHGTWAHLNGVLHKSLPSVCVSVFVSPLSLLGNGSLNTFPLQQIHQTKKNCWRRRFRCGPCRIKGEYVGLSVYPRIGAKPWLRKHVPAATKNSWGRRFLCRPCHTKEQSAVSSFKNFLFY
jgi:hypothetical protein